MYEKCTINFGADYVNLQRYIEIVDKAGAEYSISMLWTVHLYLLFLWSRLLKAIRPIT